MTFKKVSEDRYYEMLEALPPAVMTGRGFLVGEAWTHNGRGEPMFAPFVEHAGAFYEGDGPMTIAEFRALTPADVIGEVA